MNNTSKKYNKQILSYIRENFREDNMELIKVIIDKYNLIFNVLYEANYIDEYEYNNRYNYLDTGNNKIFKELIIELLVRLAHKNTLDLIDPSLIIYYVDTTSPLKDIYYLLTKIKDLNLNDNEWQNTYHFLFQSILFNFALYNKFDILSNSRYLKEEEKSILEICRRIQGNDKHVFGSMNDIDEKTYKLFVGLSYNYFKVNKMFETNYNEILIFLDKVEKDKEVIINKIVLNNITKIKELLSIFESYYYGNVKIDSPKMLIR